VKENINNLTLVGFDYSITSPAASIVTIGDLEIFNFDIRYVRFLSFYNKNEKYLPEFVQVNNLEWNSFSQRWDIISEYFINQLKNLQNVKCAIEGYAYNPRAGQLTQIAENTAILKHKLYLNGCKYKIYQPTQVKQFMTNSGKGDKKQVYNAINKKLDIDLSDLLKIPENKGPIFDLSDSLAILYMLYVDVCLRNGIDKNFTIEEKDYFMKQNKNGFSLLEEQFV
jgi:Holliday junction resolvasome RuvABC endonuclease subunit